MKGAAWCAPVAGSCASRSETSYSQKHANLVLRGNRLIVEMLHHDPIASNTLHS
jgi:hypothetical protein